MENLFSIFMSLLQNAAFCSCIFIIYTIFFEDKKSSNQNGSHEAYSRKAWYFFLKKWWVHWILWRQKLYHCSPKVDIMTAFMPNEEDEELEKPRLLTQLQEVDMMTIRATDHKGNALLVHITRSFINKMSVQLHIVLEDGSIYHLPGHGVMHAHSSTAWCGAGIRLELCEPLRRWRLTFNGLLRLGKAISLTPQNDEENIQHVRFNFLWTACSNAFNLQNNWNSNLLSEALAREHWASGKWLDMRKQIGDGYNQWGTLYGVIKIRGVKSTSKKLYLRGIRERHWGKDNVFWQHRAVSYVGVTVDGTMFALRGISCMKPGLTHAIIGQVYQPDGCQYPVDSCSLSLPNVREHPDDVTRFVSIRLSAGGKSYNVTLYSETWSALKLYDGIPLSSEIHSFMIRCNLDGQMGTGTAVYWYRYTGPSPNTSYPFSPLLKNLQLKPESDVPLTVNFKEKYCCSSAIVGEKAASLGLMSSLSENQLSAKVPQGFCITVKALEEQIRCVAKLNKAISTLEDLCQTECDLNHLQQNCDRTANLFEHTPVCETVKKAVLLQLKNQCFSESRFVAVRSSVIGEDSEELCSSVQHTNLLGVPTEIEKILDAIQACWASLFAFHSVFSRRQNGQQVRASMGVIVQTMISAECAGVLFTRDPLNGDPRILLMTSNFGLGESVVSAEVEPDVVILQKGEEKSLKVTRCICGKKSYKTIISDEGGIIKKSLRSSETSQISVGEKEMLTLGMIGINLENLFGEPREIEWAVKSETVYLLQARPIAALNSWSDFELTHEFDAPIIRDNEVLTRSLAGEMYPEAVTPLTYSVSLSSAEIAMRQGLRNGTSYRYLHSMGLTCHHPLINVYNSIINRKKGAETVLTDKIINLAIFGYEVLTPKIYCLPGYRNGAARQNQKFWMAASIVKDVMLNKYMVKQAQNLASSFKVNTECRSASEVYLQISYSLKHLAQVAEYYGQVTKISTCLQMLIMAFLANGNSELTAEHHNDIASLLSLCCSGLTAQIPVALKEVVSSIVTSGISSKFCNMNAKEASHWLESNCFIASAKLQEYLHKQGHRSISEFELMTKPWSMQPKALIKFLQSLVRKADSYCHSNNCNRDGVREKNSLKPKNGTIIVLQFLLQLCRSSISNQEKCRVYYVTVIHKLRLAYWSLADHLLREGRIPNKELLFFFTHYELGVLIKTRSAALMFRATKRRELHSQWTKISLSEINLGLPKLHFETQRAKNVTAHIKGISVSPGIAMGRACVVRGLKDIEMLEAGDILIAHSTDFGWSPYFPLLQGAVTELGGFASPGSLIAREFGIPCIVAAKNATKIFHTGDIVLMGKTGTVDRISKGTAVLN